MIRYSSGCFGAVSKAGPRSTTRFEISPGQGRVFWKMGKESRGFPHLQKQFIFCTSYYNDSVKSDNWNNSTVITKCNGILASMSCLEYMDSWIWTIHIHFNLKKCLNCSAWQGFKDVVNVLKCVTSDIFCIYWWITVSINFLNSAMNIENPDLNLSTSLKIQDFV